MGCVDRKVCPLAQAMWYDIMIWKKKLTSFPEANTPNIFTL